MGTDTNLTPQRKLDARRAWRRSRRYSCPKDVQGPLRTYFLTSTQRRQYCVPIPSHLRTYSLTPWYRFTHIPVPFSSHLVPILSHLSTSNPLSFNTLQVCCNVLKCKGVNSKEGIGTRKTVRFGLQVTLRRPEPSTRCERIGTGLDVTR